MIDSRTIEADAEFAPLREKLDEFLDGLSQEVDPSIMFLAYLIFKLSQPKSLWAELASAFNTLCKYLRLILLL